MAAKIIDRAALAVAVRTKRGRRGLRAAAKEAGVSHQTLHNIELKKRAHVGAHAFATVCDWIGVPMEFFTVDAAEEAEEAAA